MVTVDYRAVMGFIRDQVGSLVNIDSQKGRIKRLIHKAIYDVHSPKYLLRKSEDVQVSNAIAKLPCDLMRILRITNVHDQPIGYNRIGGNEAVQVKMLNGTVRVYYLGMPLKEIDDEDGVEQVPMILPEQIDYIGHYVISVMLREEWVMGRLPRDRFEYWDMVLVPEARSKAKGMSSLTSIDEMEAALYMMRNGQFIGRK